MEIELREVRPDDPAMLRLADALREEVEARGNRSEWERCGCSIPGRRRSSGRTSSRSTGAPASPGGFSRRWRNARYGMECGPFALDTNARLVEAKRMHREAGYEKPLA